MVVLSVGLLETPSLGFRLYKAHQLSWVDNQATAVLPLAKQTTVVQDFFQHRACVFAVPISALSVHICPLPAFGMLCADKKTVIVGAFKHWATQFFQLVKSFCVDAFHGDTFRVGWLNGCKKTGDTGVDPILIRKGLKHLRLGVALVQEGFDNCFERLSHGDSPSDE